MTLQLRFFASLREAVGVSSESLVLPENVRTAGELRRHLVERGGAWQAALAENRAVRIAVNQQMADEQSMLTPDCEVAFFPPVTGG